MLNPLRDFVAFDLETTGLERDTDEIIEIGAVRVREGRLQERMSCLLKAEKGLSPLVESLTGLSPGLLAEARDPKECLEEFLRFAGGAPLVAHNSDFDAAFLQHALAKAGMDPLANPVFDSLLLARIAWPTLESHRLESLVEKLGIPPQKAHRALPDAEQSALLWLKGEEKLAGYAPRTLSALGRILSAGPAQWSGFFGGSPDRQEPIGDLPIGPTADAPAASPAPAEGPGQPAPAESLFGSGKVADAFAALGRPYQPRARQARMASLAERAMRESRFLVAESEPGTGRLLACLVPAVLQARAKRRPVFVAVAGRSRQDRIVTSEVPLLKALLGEGVRVEALKAPGRYLSPRKLAGILAHPETRLSREERLAILPLITWLESTRDGDISGNMGFNHERNRLLWSKLAADSYASEPGSHAQAAKERAARAHLVIITHDLFLDDMALDFALLPTYETLIFDEAHRLPEAAQARFGRDVSFFRLKHILQSVAQSKHDASGLLAELERPEGGSPVAEAPSGAADGEAPAAEAAGAEAAGAETADAEAPTVETAGAERPPQTDLQKLRAKVFEPERQLQKFFNKIAKHASKRRKDGESRIRYADKLVMEFNAGPEAVITTLAELEELLVRLAPGREDLAPDLRKTADSLRAFRSDLEHLSHPAAPGDVFWIEDFPNPHRALIRSAPLDIGSLLAEKLYPQMDAVIFASSALALGEEFKFFCSQIGLESAFQDRLKTALVRSKAPEERPDPLLIAKFTPVLSNQAALQSMAQTLTRGLTRFRVPSFALFTHIGMLKQARGLLQESLSRNDRGGNNDRGGSSGNNDLVNGGRMVFAQHVDGSRENLLHLFRHRPDACLLGTEAFVEGLAEGDMIPEIAIVTKLPFPVPTEPLIAPRLEKLQEAGLNPLYDYLLPCSILRLKQELNRLPRRPGRKLAIWILDPRLATEKYARFYQRSLGRDAVLCDKESDLFGRTESLLGLEPEAGSNGEAAIAESARTESDPAAETVDVGASGGKESQVG